LCPEADNRQFADGYAQAVTFGLLIARAYDIEIADGIELAALKLKRTNSLIGTALSLLTEDHETQKALKTSLGALTRVLGVVNWHVISKGKPEAWLNFYEDFLDVYDKELKKKTGSYYTPPEVVDAMVRLVDEALRGPLFERPNGLASPDVTIADPAVGTGTFLLGVMRTIAATIAKDQGEGAVRAGLAAAMKRLYGFELQFGPFAVAQLRMLAEWQSLAPANTDQSTSLNLFITDTLGNPYVEDEKLPQIVEAVAKSRREANRVKRGQPIMVVIGNPPYKEKAEGRGGWIEKGSDGRSAPLDYWKAPVEWKATSQNKLKNLYVYFWRWATLKVFGSGLNSATGETEMDRHGLVCFITASGFLNGPGFQRMRDDLRRTCSNIWIIDCTPEGHQPNVQTRIFPTVQHAICIVLAIKGREKAQEIPAKVRYRSVPAGRQKEKFAYLNRITLKDDQWSDCSDEWRAPFLPTEKGLWREIPLLKSLFNYNGLGCMPGRTWVIAPDEQTLIDRWNALIRERDTSVKERLFHPHPNGDRALAKVTKDGLSGHENRRIAIGADTGACVKPMRFAFRSFDRQWLIPDNRLINRPNPNLWTHYSERQIYIVAPDQEAPREGLAIQISSLIPDLNHFKGSGGGRVYPLYTDASATTPNLKPAALALLAKTYGEPISAEDLFAYIAAVMAHPAFTARFASDLIQPGLRLPLTADAALFKQAVSLGREIVWLHSYGERFTDPENGRPKAPPRLPKAEAPYIPADGAIPPAPEPLPDTMSHDAATNRLHIGKGFINNVTKAMWDFEVSGKQVLWHWFSYRKLDRSRPIIGDRRPPSPLEKIQPDGWLADYTSDLIDLLHVLGRVIALEPEQARLLTAICDSPLIPLRTLTDAGLTAGSESTEFETEDVEKES
jgi:predicted helicase